MREPVFLRGVCKDYLWGGNRLKEAFGRDSGGRTTAESWELSCHPDGCSVVSGGRNDGMPLTELLGKYGAEEILGKSCGCAERLPLIKLIDAKEPLSVQVHPDDVYARAHGDANGKTEMWYVLDAEPGAELVYGVNRTLSQGEFAAHIENGTLEEILHYVPVKKGDVFFIPAGTLHAIGGGILIAEVQQSSNLTYRVYDYNRRDAEGNLRELHIEDALAVTKCTPGLREDSFPARTFPWGTVQVLVHCPYFAVSHISVYRERSFETSGTSFTHLLILEGEGRLETSSGVYPLKKGSSVLLPAKMGHYCISGMMCFIETHIPDAEEIENQTMEE